MNMQKSAVLKERAAARSYLFFPLYRRGAGSEASATFSNLP